MSFYLVLRQHTAWVNSHRGIIVYELISTLGLKGGPIIL